MAQGSFTDFFLCINCKYLILFVSVIVHWWNGRCSFGCCWSDEKTSERYEESLRLSSCWMEYGKKKAPSYKPHKKWWRTKEIRRPSFELWNFFSLLSRNSSFFYDLLNEGGCSSSFKYFCEYFFYFINIIRWHRKCFSFSGARTRRLWSRQKILPNTRETSKSMRMFDNSIKKVFSFGYCVHDFVS